MPREGWLPSSPAGARFSGTGAASGGHVGNLVAIEPGWHYSSGGGGRFNRGVALQTRETMLSTVTRAIGRTTAFVIALAVLVPPAASARQKPASPHDADAAQALLQRYCLACHTAAREARGLVPVAFDRLDAGDVGADAAVWEQIVRKLRLGMMPPAGRPRPAADVHEQFLGGLESALDAVAAERPDPGRPAVRRLTTPEYRNAVRSVLGLEVDEGWLLFPPDDVSQEGFSTDAEALSVSPALFDRYLSAANRISRLAVGDPAVGPGFAAATWSTPRLLYQDDRMSEDLPFGSRGGMAVRHYFPLDGDYRVKIRLRRMIYDYIVGMGTPQQIEVRLDGRLVRRFTVGGADRFGYPSAYSFFGTIRGDPAWEQYVSIDADADLEVTLPVPAGEHIVGVSFVAARTEPTGILERRLSGFSLSGLGFYDGHAAVERVEIAGPYDAAGPGDTASRRRIFSCRPAAEVAAAGAVAAPADDGRCAGGILSALGRRAYRRPLTGGDLDTLLAFYEQGRAEGGFETGIRKAIERLLVAPEFLFRIERDPPGLPPGTAYRLSDLELASRLSLFLWSDIPDEPLLAAAEAGRLSEPDELDRQVERMLADPRARALVDNFASQWLQLGRVRGVIPDADVFYEFDENLRADMERETTLFLESQMLGDRGVMELFDADYTFVNERLARHYGLDGVYGGRFRRVAAVGDRTGLLGHASLLTLTAYPTRTSPVLRGKWLLDNVLGMPPAEPPADVPALEENHGASAPRTMRERMERHRANPACAACHRMMDPPGFALEHFDAIGRWRATDEYGVPVDAAGALADGAAVDGPAALRHAVLAYETSVVRTVTEKLLTYAVGRRMESFDQPAIRRIVRDAEAGGHRWSSIIRGIVESVPFQMRRSEP